MIPTILKGDDTSAYGRTITVNLPEGDLTGITFYFAFLGIVKDFTIDAGGQSHLDIDYTADETRMMPLGTHMATLCAVGSTGTAYTVSNSIPIKVTDNVHECYGTNGGTIDIGVSGSGSSFSLPWLDTINGNPKTPDELVAAWHEFIERLKASAGVLLLGAILMVSAFAFADGITVQTAPSGSIPFTAPVVTNVVVEGELGLGVDAVTEIAEKAARDATNALPPIATWDPDAGVLTLGEQGGIVWKDTPMGFSRNGNRIVFSDATHSSEPLSSMNDLDGYLRKTKKELHADSVTNVCWQTVYSNGWVYLLPFSVNVEDAQ